jgi:hypothetical protein
MDGDYFKNIQIGKIFGATVHSYEMKTPTSIRSLINNISDDTNNNESNIKTNNKSNNKSNKKSKGVFKRMINDEYYGHVQKIIKKYNDTYLISTGFYDEKYMKFMNNALLPLKKKIQPKRIWIADNVLLADSFLKLFPTIDIQFVSLGYIPEKYYNNPRITIHQCVQKFNELPLILPPYPSESHFDGKIWQFIKVYGKTGDYIFNSSGYL